MSIVNKILKEASLNELFDSNAVYEYTMVDAEGNTREYVFDTEDHDYVRVILLEYNTQNGWGCEIQFKVNGSFSRDEDADGMKPRVYIKVLKTVAEIVSEYAKYMDPDEFKFSATVESGKTRSKRYSIYNSIVNSLNGMYVVYKVPGDQTSYTYLIKPQFKDELEQSRKPESNIESIMSKVDFGNNEDNIISMCGHFFSVYPNLAEVILGNEDNYQKFINALNKRFLELNNKTELEEYEQIHYDEVMYECVSHYLYSDKFQPKADLPRLVQLKKFFIDCKVPPIIQKFFYGAGYNNTPFGEAFDELVADKCGTVY